jgi:hypothetical protein
MEVSINASVQPLKQYLPELRQFAFIMTGDEEAANAALNAAFECVEAARHFPCHRSWIFALLLRALERSGSAACPDLGVAGSISLLQIPPQERAVLILAEGFKFDIATTLMITGRSMQQLDRLLTVARLRLQDLSTAYGCSQEHEPSLQ